ncbi:ABC transporter substrate-binding protein [Demequina sp.]|uniref:ABC transporter substrate-binding protein n=1 Tax=Demequina sp. TaxID=2050685 RepID=UPI003A83BFC8
MTKSNKGRAIATVTAVSATALALTACSAPAEEPTDTPEATDQVTSEPIELTYLHRLPDGEGMVTVQEIVDRWNADNPDIQVNPVKFDGASAEMTLKLETDINAGVGPCLAQVGYSEVPDMWVKGLLQDVTDFSGQYASNFAEGAFNAMAVGGSQVGLPQDTGPLVYFYNEAAFEELGLEVPTTADDFTEAAATAAEDGKYIAAFTPDEAQNWLSGQAAAAGDAWYTATDAGWAVDTVGEGTQQVADFWQTMLDDESVYVGQRWGDGFTQALVDGQLVGHIGPAWEAGFMLDPLDGTDAEGQWRVAQLPDFGAGVMSGPDGGSGVAVMSGCEYPEQAMEFNNWFNTQVDDLATQGLLVAADASVETPEKMARQFGGQDVMAEFQAANANLNPDFVYSPGFLTLSTMNQKADEVAAGTADVIDIFETAQADSVTALTNLGLPVAE